VKSIWIPRIKEYQIQRLSEGAAASTVNKEKAALSKIFQVLMELRHLEVNPARMVRGLSEKDGEREIYISSGDYHAILRRLPRWVQPITQTAYFTGMRRGEILCLTRRHIDLKKRLIYLGSEEVKERKRKRVPVHRDLVPILLDVMKVQALGSDNVFLVDGKPPYPDSVRKPWVKAVKAVGLEPAPTFHDLRHTWAGNADRSGMPEQIREKIWGHWNRGKDVSERYPAISDDCLVRAIDNVTFDHGETEILVSSRKEKSDSRSRTPMSEILGTNWEQSATR